MCLQADIRARGRHRKLHAPSAAAAATGERSADGSNKVHYREQQQQQWRQQGPAANANEEELDLTSLKVGGDLVLLRSGFRV
jgi:hypothetical protein